MRWDSTWVAAALILALSEAAGAQGRPLSVTGTQLLDFGSVFPGVQQIVPWSDPAKGGRFSLTGANRSEIQLIFTLPLSLTAPGGKTLLLQFGPNDGAWNQQNAAGTAQAFDPRSPLVVRLSNQGRMFIYLGGTARPSGTQSAGNYTGSITLTASYTGN